VRGAHIRNDLASKGALPNVILELRDDAENYSSLRGRIVSTAVGR
jgi:hypothetical protein